MMTCAAVLTLRVARLLVRLLDKVIVREERMTGGGW